jgi:hypothetical protein
MIDDDVLYTVYWYAYYYHTVVILFVVIYVVPITLTLLGVRKWIRRRNLSPRM